MKQYDLIVVIGRFQPFHNGHKSLIDKALDLAEHVTILCGSSNKPRSSKNPWTFLEREEMINSVYPEAYLDIVNINDYLYDDLKWVKEVSQAVEGIVQWHNLPETASIGLLGHFKDRSSYYLSMFPNWELIEGPSFEGINATDIRKELFLGMSPDTLPMPKSVSEYLICSVGTEHFQSCMNEYKAIYKEKEKKSSYPYDLNEVTVDAVVVHRSGKVLLIKRGGAIGNGLWALPGGYLNKNENLYEGCVRELLEETQLNLVPPGAEGLMATQEAVELYTKSELRRCFVWKEIFDHPERSLAGRLITGAHLFVLDTPYLPTVKGGDDAAKAIWHPIDLVESDYMHDDHADIINSMARGVR